MDHGLTLGEMITDLNLEPDEPVEEGCGDCNICVDACPTGALIEGGQLNANKCIAFLTQTRGFLPDEYRSKLGNRSMGVTRASLFVLKTKENIFIIILNSNLIQKW